jgi:putative oxidoreductase
LPLELFGGILLIVGLLTRFVAAGLAIDMLVAILTVRAKGGFFVPNGMEFELLLLAGSLALVFAGPGRISIEGRREVLEPRTSA